MRISELLALLSIGAAQGLSVATSVPRLAPTALAVPISIALLLARRGDSLLFLGIATMTIVSFEPAPCDVFFGFYILHAACVGLFKSKQEYLQRWRRLPSALRWSLYIYVFLNLIIFVVDPSVSSARFAVITFYLIALFMAISVSPRSKELAFVAGVGYLASFAYVLAATWIDAESFLQMRFQAWFKDPNVLAAYTVPAILLLTALVITPRRETHPRRSMRTTPRLLALVGLWMIIALLLRTASRGALVAVVPGVVLVLARCWRPTWTPPSASLVVIGLLVVTALGLSPLTEWLLGFSWSTPSAAATATRASTGVRLTWVLERFTKPDLGRLNTYQAGFKAALEYPMGVGPGNYERHVVEFADPSLPLAHAAHNLYLRTWVEQGLLGLVSLSLFLGLASYLILKRTRSATAESWLTQAMLVTIPPALLSIYVHSFLIDTLHWRHLWVLLGVGIGAISDVESNRDHLSPRVVTRRMEKQ